MMDLNFATVTAAAIRQNLLPARVKPPNSWRKLASHYLEALQNSWYEAMFILQNTFRHACIQFFQNEMA